MIKIEIPHWCPNCRVNYMEWEVKSKKKAVITKGGTWPVGAPLVELIEEDCKSCGARMRGQTIFEEDEDSGLNYLMFVREV